MNVKRLDKYIKDHVFGKFSSVYQNFDKQKITWNLIENNITLGEYKKRFHVFNRVFKYSFFVPLLFLAKKILGKCFVKKENLDTDKKNEIEHAWFDMFEFTIKEWCAYYRTKRGDDYKKVLHDQSSNMLRDMNSIMMSGVVNDGAYRTFFEMLAINWGIKISEMYKDKIDYLIYNGKTINDSNFYKIIGNNADHLIINRPNGFIVVKKDDAVVVENINERFDKKSEWERLKQDEIGQEKTKNNEKSTKTKGRRVQRTSSK
jgi:hypothetical protein